MRKYNLSNTSPFNEIKISYSPIASKTIGMSFSDIETKKKEARFIIDQTCTRLNNMGVNDISTKLKENTKF